MNAIGGSGSTGWDWVVWSFEQAREAFPNSKLLINDYGIISDPSATANYVKIINILKSRGLIDGIGIQCHYFNMNNVSVSTMNSVLNTLSATGLPIYVSELDITGNDSEQLAIYQQKFPVLWENPNVKGITLWGYTEGATWTSDSYLITSSGAERPALTWLKNYLASSGSGGSSSSSSSSSSSTPSTATGNLEVQMYNGNTQTSINGITPRYKLINTGSSAIDLSNIKLRYYYTEDGTQSQTFWCDWSSVGSSNVIGTFKDGYLEISFASGAGTLAPGANIEVQGRFSKNDWTNYDQSNDYSFNATGTSYVDWTKVTAYQNGSLIWGVEP